ncbi:MAG: alpha amylase C-terminal domain-containing protein [Planctomycetaceae bacterium]|nr:alpha amylase C-terminal domain-containing protein [Planctomycetaceae bacterium]
MPVPVETVPPSDIRPGMGAILHAEGVAFRVWAPHANSVCVVGTFNDWTADAHPMIREEHDTWYVDVLGARPGDEYRFLIRNGDQELSRIDPYARLVTNSIGNGIIYDSSAFDWEEDGFTLFPHNELIIYEMHVGTFHDADGNGGRPGTFHDAIEKLGHLKKLGVNCIELMPSAEFAGDYSWGYNPAHPFAVEQAYGGPDGLKDFVKAAHRAGMAVVMDVVYNHFGPSDLDLWRFDGWGEGDKGGIYFYNDDRSQTPWGDTRPDYGREEVRRYLLDNALMWLKEYRCDGLRYDMTLYIRTSNKGNLPEGWALTQRLNGAIRERFPDKITIAEDLQNNEWLTKSIGEGGAGFHAQWCAAFVHPIRGAVTTPSDDNRSMNDVRNAIVHNYNGQPFQRVIYSESHDEVANGKARVPQEVMPDDPGHYFARKRAGLAAAIVLTTPGIPMLFQGQELLTDGWFQDTVPLDWDRAEEFPGTLRLYRDLIHLRRNVGGRTKGLTGSHVDVFHVNDNDNVLAFRRWVEGGPGDDVLVVANFSHFERRDYRIGAPTRGRWLVRLNSDAKCYGKGFGAVEWTEATANDEPYDGKAHSLPVALGPYSIVILSQDG